MPHRYDVIFIGGGHNGLAAAARLAGAGLRVLVLERREIVGGAAVTEEIFPGFRVSTAAYLISLLQQKVVDELDLSSFGYQVDPKDPAFFSLFPDGRTLTMWRDEAKTLAELARFSEHDADIYPAYGRFVSRLAGVVEPMLLRTPPNVPPRSPGDVIESLRLAGRLRGLDRRHLSGLLKIMTQSAGEFLDEWFESDEIKATLATDGVIGANGGPLSPGTAYVLLHHVMGGVGGVPGLWGFVRGGMGALTEAMAAAARARGAEIRCGADVQRIIVRNGRARGVALASGDEYQARAVVSNADPKRTFLGLLGPDDLDPAFRAGIERYRSEGTSLKINLALDGLPEFRAAPGPGPHHGATMHICPSIEYMERAWDDAKYGRPSRNPIIEMTIPDDLRPVVGAAGQTHHGDLPAIRALYPARGHMGRHSRILRRPCDRRDRRVRPQPSVDHSRSPGADPARFGARLRVDRREYLSRGDEPRSALRRQAVAGVGALSNAGQEPLPVRRGRAPGRRRDGGGGLETRRGRFCGISRSRGRGPA